MAIDFEPLKKLVPVQRIKELQELIEKLKTEIQERKEDIKEAEHLLIQADDEARVLEQMEVPEIRQPKKTKIEEKLEGKPKRLAELELEELLETAPPRSSELLHEVAHRPVPELASELEKIYTRQKETGIETREDREMLYAIRKGFEIKKEEGYRPATKKDKHLMTEAEQWAEHMYQGTSETYKKTPA